MTRGRAKTAPAPAPARKKDNPKSSVLVSLLAAVLVFGVGCWWLGHKTDSPATSVLPTCFLALAIWAYCCCRYQFRNFPIAVGGIIAVVLAGVIVNTDHSKDLGEAMAKAGKLVPSSSDSTPPAPVKKGHGK